MIDIVIADDHKLFAQGLANLLNTDPHLQVTAIFNDGRSLLDHLQSQPAQVALIDLNMPFFNGEKTLQRMKEQDICCKKIVITMYADERLLKSCLALGIDAYLLKNTELDVVIDTIKAVVAGTYVLDQIASAQPLEEDPVFKDDFLNVHKLSKREVEIVRLVAKGLTSAEIADMLFLSILTVDTHRRNIHQKLKVKNTAELIQLAFKQDLYLQ